ncbi:MAG TPA: class I SAM-dependent methyltransferase [Pyrinomonadaceae bacterium]|nr:class I SAM-dependent methyltransferase [Pyrinomonadaceae bacterium]
MEATRLLWRTARSRLSTRLANKFLREKITCPCCGWNGRRFYDYIEVGYTIPRAACPRCDSHARHRTLYLWLEREYRLQNKSGVALVFAPERALAPTWDAATSVRAYRVDVAAARGVDLLADLQRLPITSDAVDIIWCHHVLEHIEDDLAAIRELYRVVRPGVGELIVSVPMEEGLKRTREYGFADPRESGHWRIYGDDFMDRLAATGFSVQAVDYRVSAEEAARYGAASEKFLICRKATL